MKFQKKVEKGIMEGDLTPMIDVTFQLIAFFMLLINFSEVDRSEEIMLPSSKLAKPPEVRPDFQIILNLVPDGSIRLYGREIENIDFIAADLTRAITAAQRENVAPKDIAVIIRSHSETPTGLVQKLITKCQESELENFSLRVKEDIRR